MQQRRTQARPVYTGILFVNKIPILLKALNFKILLNADLSREYWTEASLRVVFTWQGSSCVDLKWGYQ